MILMHGNSMLEHKQLYDWLNELKVNKIINGWVKRTYYM